MSTSGDAPDRRLRMFWAFVPPEEVRAAVADHAAPLQRAWPDLRWVPTAQLHVTAEFLPSVPPDRVGMVLESVRQQLAAVPPLQVGLIGGAETPGPRAQVLWLPVDPPEKPSAVAGVVARACADVLAGDAALAGRRPWRGHMTLARVPRRVAGDDPSIGAQVAREYEGPPVAWRADRVVLFRSDLGQQGAIHTPVGDALLAGSAASPPDVGSG